MSLKQRPSVVIPKKIHEKGTASQMEVGRIVGSPNLAFKQHIQRIKELDRIKQDMKDNFNFVDKSLEVPQTLSDNFLKNHLQKYKGFIQQEDLSPMKSPTRKMKELLRKKSMKKYRRLSSLSLFDSPSQKHKQPLKGVKRSRFNRHSIDH